MYLTVLFLIIVQCHQKNSKKDIEDSRTVFSTLLRSIERSQAELIEVIQRQQKAAEKRAKGLIAELEQEIINLERHRSKVAQLSDTEDSLHLLQVGSCLTSSRREEQHCR